MAYRFFYIACGIFLLAGAWSLVADDLPNLREVIPQAQAQVVLGPYSGPPLLYLNLALGAGFAVDIEGYLWRIDHYDAGNVQWNRLGQVFPPNTPIPTATGNMSDLKAMFGGGD